MKIAITLIVVLATIAMSTAVPKPLATKRVVCYFESWAVYNEGEGSFDVEDIDPSICTHIIYSFVGLGTDNKVRVLDPWHDLPDDGGEGAMKRFTGLRSQNPNLKAMLAIGGWSEGSEQYSKMVSSAASRKTFIDSILPLLESQGFDGLDFDWEYPTARGGQPEDRDNFSLLLKELRAAFEQHGYLLSAAISADEGMINDAYNVPDLSNYLDFVNVMTYDFHGDWDPFVHHHSPLYGHAQDSTPFNSDYTMNVLKNLGADPAKLNLGIGTYGRGWILDNEQNHDIYAAASNPIDGGLEPGYWAYHQICAKVADEQWTVVRDTGVRSPYAYKGTRWIGYDDPTSVALKGQYVQDNGFGGMMTWAIDTDDFRGNCHSEPFPLVKAMFRAMVKNE